MLNDDCDENDDVVRGVVMAAYGVRLSLLLSLLRQEYRLYVGQNATLSDGHAGQEFVELLVVAYRQLEVPRYDPGLLVVPGRVSGQLEHLGGQVLHHGGEVHGRAGAHPLGVVAVAQQPVDSPHGKLQAGTVRARLDLALYFSTFAASGHNWMLLVSTHTNIKAITHGPVRDSLFPYWYFLSQTKKICPL